ncbi:RHS repeat-associated core domain-containing protein [Peristeroidobacter agariperforans]|uniref:RHS repeat-associated core domain-containing protein n=1 Tax=Peristeroidobacter agariperforans TaxID=268404 RepID=UPI0018E58F17|nr:RHS repeat-associated core domain-containing protein [Peristeroidobacter agariperforans]
MDFNDVVTCYESDLARNLEAARVEGFAAGTSCPANLAEYTPASGTRQRKITTQWHPTFRLQTRVDESARRTTFVHDMNGNVLTKTILDTATSESRTWTYSYNSFGQMLTVDGPRTDVQDVTTYAYYNCTTGLQCGQVHTITNALGHVTTYNTYNAHGQPLTITDPNGVVTTLSYDPRQRVTARTVGSEQAIFDYWPTGLLKKTTMPDGSFLEYTYDDAHRLVEIEDSEGNRIVYTLDAMGNRTGEELYDPSNVLTQTRTRVFNTLNQLWKQIAAAGTANVTTSFAYDDNGNQTSIDAPLGRSTAQVYDELHRLSQVTDALSGVTEYDYNALDQLISVTDPRSKVTSYTYNALGDLVQQVSPDTGTTSSTFDAGGNLQVRTDARGKTATYSYDALNRVTQLAYPDQTISYQYDQGAYGLGRVTSVANASGSTSWTHTSQGRVASKTQAIGSVTKSVNYAYNSAGQLETLTPPSGIEVTYGYTNNQITSIRVDGILMIEDVLYEPFGPVRGWTWGNGSLAVRQHDLDGNLALIDSAGLSTYGYDDAMRITSIADVEDSSRSWTYGYDTLDRLAAASRSGLSQTFSYDAIGNRLSQGGTASSSYSVSTSSNRLTSVSGSLSRTYGYDNAGNVTSDGTTTFTYDDAGRMVSSTRASLTATYLYNPLGQRVKKSSGADATYFVYDEAGRLIGEYDSTGELIQEIVWMNDIPVLSIRWSSCGMAVFYIHTDHLNTPRRITKRSSPEIVWRWDSAPFGTTAVNEDPDANSSAFAFNLRFPGQYFDHETGLHYNYYRDYDPATGRYVQSDPLGIEDDLNTYAYVHSNPLKDVDPLGLGRATGLPEKHSGKICGSGWSFTLVPESYRGIVPFTSACRSHDRCYETCGMSRGECDRRFREDARKLCSSAHARLGTRLTGDCVRRANRMADVVEWLGEGPYRRAQAKCQCGSGSSGGQ